MLNRIHTTDPAHLRGLLWIQGESEALISEPETYEEKLLHLIDSFREDVGRPDLPVLIVQIGRMININPEMGRDWEAVREAQRQAVRKRENVYMTSGIDLELDDCIHYSTAGNEILGKRLAELALTNIYRQPGHGMEIEPYSLTLMKDSLSGSHYLHLDYRGVSGALKAEGIPSTFELRFGNETSWYHVISRVNTDPGQPSALNLFLSGIPEKPAHLVCGPGINPHMNITDSLNMPVPAFGPIELDFEELETETFYF
jgi:sialate O-acetylesterase